MLSYTIQKERTSPHRGACNRRIIDVKDDGTINISLLPRKEEGMEDDAAVIYAYMEERGGAMRFGIRAIQKILKNALT